MISIVIPVRNGLPFLEETLRSVKRQSVPPAEVVIVDNHSTDGTTEWLRTLGTWDGSLRVVQPPQPLPRMVESWNFAAGQTTSDWFVLLSHDDLLRPNFVKLAREVSGTTDAAAIAFRAEHIDGNGRLVQGKLPLGRARLVQGRELVMENLTRSSINVASVVIRRTAWVDASGYPAQFNLLHDLVFWQELASLGGVLRHPAVTARYRVHDSAGKSQSRQAALEEDIRYYRSVRLGQLAESWNLDPEVVGAAANSFDNLGVGSPRVGLHYRAMTKVCQLTDLMGWRKW